MTFKQIEAPEYKETLVLPKLESTRYSTKDFAPYPMGGKYIFDFASNANLYARVDSGTQQCYYFFNELDEFLVMVKTNHKESFNAAKEYFTRMGYLR